MDERYLRARVGNLNQIAYAKRVQYQYGKAQGLHAIEIDNGSGLSCSILEDRALDIAKCSYRGINISFLAKNGITSLQHCNQGDGEFGRYFYGGMLYTCGLKNVGPSTILNNKLLPLHGRIGVTPAEEVNITTNWNEKVITISGRIIESSLFGKNISMFRTIKVPIFGNEIEVIDVIKNDGFADEDIMLLYHCNFGWPMLSEHTTLNLSSSQVEPRDSISEKGINNWNKFQEPADGCDEEVFYHSPAAEHDGLARARVTNKELGITVTIAFDPNQLPHLIQWKSMASGDYALGIEPSTSRVDGYETEILKRRYKRLQPGESCTFRIKIQVKEDSK